MEQTIDHRALVAKFVARCGVNYPDMHIDAFNMDSDLNLVKYVWEYFKHYDVFNN